VPDAEPDYYTIWFGSTSRATHVTLEVAVPGLSSRYPSGQSSYAWHTRSAMRVGARTSNSTHGLHTVYGRHTRSRSSEPPPTGVGDASSHCH